MQGDTPREEDSDADEDQIEALKKKLESVGLKDASIKRNQVGDSQLVK